MAAIINILYSIGLLLWFIPTLSALQISMKNFKEKDYLGGIVQLIMTICIMTVYVIAILVFRIGLHNIFFILSVTWGYNVL